MEIIDDLNRKVEYSRSPRRIISLCPSITETIIEIGGPGKVIGRTRFCIHPKEEIQNIEKVGGTKKVDLDKIRSLKPDFIFCEKEENTPEIVSSLEKLYPTFVSDVVDIPSALKMITDVGAICGEPLKSQKLVEKVKENLHLLDSVEIGTSVLYYIWKDPWMVAGRDTYINSLLERVGFENLGTQLEGRYPEVSFSSGLEQRQPDYIFLSSEPYPFKELNIQEMKEQFPDSNVLLVDGEYFSWYGTRMVGFPSYFTQLIKSYNH